MKKLKIGSKSGLRYFTMADIRRWNPCYDPAKYIKEDFKGTALTVLKLENVPVEDRLWAVLRTEVLSERVTRLFAVWCARQVQHLMRDARSLRALDVVERFANGEATDDERVEAKAAAAAATAAAATYGATYGASYDAAYAPAYDAAYAAAYAAAYGASYADAAYGAAYAAAYAAAAYGASRKNQINKLIEMVTTEGLEIHNKRSSK